MAEYSAEVQTEHKELVRQAMAISPRASALTIRKILEKNGRPLDVHYIIKLRRKIEVERKIRFNYAKVDAEIARLEDENASAVTELWKILLNLKNPAGTRAFAATAIIKANNDMLRAKMDAGIFERQIGTVKVAHEHSIADDSALLIMQALGNYGIIKPATIIEQPAGLIEQGQGTGTDTK